MRGLLNHLFPIAAFAAAVLLLLFNFKTARVIWRRFGELKLWHQFFVGVLALGLVFFYLIFDVIFGISLETFAESTFKYTKKTATGVACQVYKFNSCPGPAGISDDAAWLAAQESNSAESYEAYSRAHPQGQHIKDARAAIAEIEADEAEWAKAQGADSAESYDAYLRPRPQGRKAGQARARLTEIKAD